MSAMVTHIAPKHAVDTFSTHVIAYRNRKFPGRLHRAGHRLVLAARPGQARRTACSPAAAVDNGTALSGSARGTFFYFLVGGPRSASDPWGQVVTQEAASLGKSAIVPQFLAQMEPERLTRVSAAGYPAAETPATSSGKESDSARTCPHRPGRLRPRRPVLSRAADLLRRELRVSRGGHHLAGAPPPGRRRSRPPGLRLPPGSGPRGSRGSSDLHACGHSRGAHRAGAA